MVVDKLYEVMKSEDKKTIPFKFVSLFLLKELVKKCDGNSRFLEYLTEKCCNKFAKWCAEEKSSQDGRFLFSEQANEKGRQSLGRADILSKVSAAGSQLRPGLGDRAVSEEASDVEVLREVQYTEERENRFS